MTNERARYPRYFFYFSISILSLVLVVATAGCAKKDIDKVAEAQDCLDTSAASEALTCIEKVQGVETEGSYLVRCAAHLIYQEFTNPTRLVQISKQLSEKSSTASSSAIAIGLLAFSKPNITTGQAYAAEAFGYCVKSKSKGMLLLAAMSRIATEIAAVGGATVLTDCDTASPTYNATTCQTAVQNSVCSASNATVGAAAQAAYTQSCLGSAQQDSSACAQFAAVNASSSDPATVGSTLKSNLRNNGSNCP